MSLQRLEMRKRVEQGQVETPRPQAQMPLCYELYARLRGVARRNNAGEVLIANPGELTRGYEVPHQTYGRRVQIAHWGETYRLNCIFCNDTKHRLWIPHIYGQPEKDIVNGGTRPGAYYGICFNEQCLEDPENRERLWEEVFGTRNRDLRSKGLVPSIETERGVAVDFRLTEKPLPGRCIPLISLPDSDPAIIYLTGRRFTREHMRYYDLMLCVEPDHDYRPALNRIVCPFVYDEVRVGWQCRWVGEERNRLKQVPKYYTLGGFKKSWILYNYDRAQHNNFVVVMEGVTDVWRLGDCGVAILGNKISSQQMDRLLFQWGGRDKLIVLCLDPGVLDESALAVRQMIDAGANIVCVQLPEGADPADYDREVLWAIIRQQVEDRGIKTLPSAI